MENKKYDAVIAIDGPAGSGKSTVAKMIAQKVGATYIDTGAMFRALGLVIDRAGVNVMSDKLTSEEEQTVATKLSEMNFQYAVSSDVLIDIDGEDLTQKIREHHVSSLASHVSKFPIVRTYLAEFQRKLPQQNLCVMEGRDIGTVIFPKAFLKIFLTASAQERAKRRFLQLEQRGETVDFDKLLADIIERDKNDSSRAVAPLKQADDAVGLDTSDMSLEEVIEKISSMVETNKGKLS